MANTLFSPAELKAKTPEQRKFIVEFFDFQGGCFKKQMDVAVYKTAVKARKDSMNIQSRALNKLGLDLSQVNEIPPVEFVGFNYGNSQALIARGVSSMFDTTWLFFSSDQIFAYSVTFDMTSDTIKERTEEYFYKDVTNFASSSDSIEKQEKVVGGCMFSPKIEMKKVMVEETTFSIVVPGDRFKCAMTTDSTIESRIQAMKQKLREKKA